MLRPQRKEYHWVLLSPLPVAFPNPRNKEEELVIILCAISWNFIWFETIELSSSSDWISAGGLDSSFTASMWRAPIIRLPELQDLDCICFIPESKTTTLWQKSQMLQETTDIETLCQHLDNPKSWDCSLMMPTNQVIFFITAAILLLSLYVRRSHKRPISAIHNRHGSTFSPKLYDTHKWPSPLVFGGICWKTIMVFFQHDVEKILVNYGL